MQKVFVHNFLSQLITVFRSNISIYPNENLLSRKTLLCNSFENGDKLLTSLTKLVLEEKASISSMIKGKLLLYYRKFSGLVPDIII